jgi:hypothetical protein
LARHGGQPFAPGVRTIGGDDGRMETIGNGAFEAFSGTEMIDECGRVAADRAGGRAQREILDAGALHLGEGRFEERRIVEPALAPRLLLFQHC